MLGLHIHSLHMPHVNIALDTFALIVTLIIFIACVREYSKKRIAARYFLFCQLFIIVALVADIVAWLGEGNPSWAVTIILSNTIMACACRLAIHQFMAYLVASLYTSSRAAKSILSIFSVLCALSILFCITNAIWQHTFYVSELGHYEHTGDLLHGFLYLLYPILASFTLVFMALFAKSSVNVSGWVFLVYTSFPIAGVILDYAIHGIALTCVGFTISILVIYTNIYLTRRKELEEQRNALMLSQINPHFIYNTLSTVAAMCDVSPKQAKHLTIDFAQYLRRNIRSMTCESLIPFEQELEHVECYAKIEKARFRERLNVIYSVSCTNFKIPPLTIQPIVENAIKHGITKKAAGGTVKISTFEDDRNYIIEIIDDGVGFDTERAELHVGLENVRSRLRAMCGGDVTVKSTVDVGTRVRMEIPKKKKKKGAWR